MGFEQIDADNIKKTTQTEIFYQKQPLLDQKTKLEADLKRINDLLKEFQ